ncbi:MAG: NAD(+)/NADH kinase [Gemmatimonadales bacterium]|nr:NAD(+)/NADH kinase [Gemmatimonadales bacterium]
MVGNPRYADLPAALACLERDAAAHGLALHTEPRLAPLWSRPLPSIDGAGLDLLLTFGGDGTLLYGARLLAGADTPILGVNFGRVGYLTGATGADVPRLAAVVARQDYLLETRLALEATVQGPSGSVVAPFFALNDVAIHKGGFARVVRFDVIIDGENAGPYSCDGLIVATPTGSTAYSLSAGGPVVDPTVEALIVTPVCAHTLAVRPVVVPAHATIRVRPLIEWAEDILVSVDGQTGHALAEGQLVEVRRARSAVRLARLDGGGFITRLRAKLHWGDLSGRQREG